MPCVLWGLSTLAGGNVNSFRLCVSSTNCSACCFPLVLFSVLWSFTPHICRSARVKGPLLQISRALSAQAPCLQYSAIKILAPWTRISISSMWWDQWAPFGFLLLCCCVEAATRPHAGQSQDSLSCSFLLDVARYPTSEAVISCILSSVLAVQAGRVIPVPMAVSRSPAVLEDQPQPSSFSLREVSLVSLLQDPISSMFLSPQFYLFYFF